MNKKLLSIENKIKNSKCQITKNILYYAIAPIVILLVGIILFCTVGFNGSTQFAGGSRFTIYINNGGEIAAAAQYDINEDYGIICNKLNEILADGNISAESFQKTQIDIEGMVVGGDAVKVVFKNTSQNLDTITAENEAIKNRVLAEFGYSTYTDAMTEVEHFDGSASLSWALTLIASLIFAATVALVYMSLRTRSASWILGLVQIAIDLVLALGLMLICRVALSTAVLTAVAVCAVVSAINVFTFYSKANSGVENGLFDNLKNNKIADTVVKSMAFKKIVIYAFAVIAALIFVVMPVNELRNVAGSIILVMLATFYTSNFILPSIWAVSFRHPKKKRIVEKEANN